MPSNMRREKSTEMDINNITTDDDIYEDNVHVENTKKTGRRHSNPSKGGKSSNNLDRRRQVHVTCEHRRRKEIQDALDALEAELPNSIKPRSKGAIIVDSADMIKELTFALDRLLNENQSLLNQIQVNELTK